ncbi:MAG TPA: VTT domain-containing protein [Tepidiformaceae bacterium]|jgi:membrane-associated protein|nr:VTT domain-containing protein [Tepidiformaceae bacterium]
MTSLTVAFLALMPDIESLINTVGWPGLFLIVFAETGLLIGFFLPGDTLLLTAGLLCNRGTLSVGDHDGIWLLIPLLIVAAVVGDAVGYQIGRKTGPRLFTSEDSVWLNRKHLDKATAFYEKHGGKTIVLARFSPFIRTFAPTVAGAAGMAYGRFAFYNITGGIAWVTSMTLTGYFLGNVPHIDLVFILVVVGVLAVSVAPAAWHLFRTWRESARASAEAGAE